MAEKLYRFYWDCGRGGDEMSTFVADSDLVEKCIGRFCYLGEILGKHSEVQGTLDADDLSILTDDADFIAKAKDYGLVPSGPNPIERIIDWAYEQDEDWDFIRSIGLEVPKDVNE